MQSAIVGDGAVFRPDPGKTHLRRPRPDKSYPRLYVHLVAVDPSMWTIDLMYDEHHGISTRTERDFKKACRHAGYLVDNYKSKHGLEREGETSGTQSTRS